MAKLNVANVASKTVKKFHNVPSADSIPKKVKDEPIIKYITANAKGEFLI